MTTEKYANEYLYREIREIENNIGLNAIPDLTVYEKAIIFKYSDDGYEDLNERLRLSERKDISDFGILLDECLSKLSDYRGIVFRGVEMTYNELDKYRLAFINKKSVTEHFFLSTSESKAKAYEWSRGNYKVLFRILSKIGKVVESVTKYKTEKEILFRYDSDFIVDNFTFDENNNIYFITKTEI
jgi:hypothetical protein